MSPKPKSQGFGATFGRRGQPSGRDQSRLFQKCSKPQNLCKTKNHGSGINAKFGFTKAQKTLKLMICLDPKGPPAPMSIFWSQKGRDPGRDPLVLWWDPGPLSFVVGPGTRAGPPEFCGGTRAPLVLWWDPGPGPGPLSFVVGPGTRAGTPDEVGTPPVAVGGMNQKVNPF